ncbi:hypothetical protein [Caballeronia sp. LZ032]|uniref:hypothetical protein n=1 Tax=Caballeronia sp. LZ032 TaxID=3038565 RepID=UPI00286678EA|nr:hypothetical protein [Caballeronia sp. LZ032]MDR5877820.1 hypothetical protein [Caballeronia sp. LZ032]
MLIFGKVNNTYQQMGMVMLKVGGWAEGMSIKPDKTNLVVAINQGSVAPVDIRDALAGTAKPSFVNQSNGGTIANPGTFGTSHAGRQICVYRQ